MQEPGTLFRFQADPEQTVYRVISMTQLFTGNTPESDVWDRYTYTDTFVEYEISNQTEEEQWYLKVEQLGRRSEYKNLDIFADICYN